MNYNTDINCSGINENNIDRVSSYSYSRSSTNLIELKKPNILVNGLVMERILNMNIFYMKQLLYQGKESADRNLGQSNRFFSIFSQQCLYRGHLSLMVKIQIWVTVEVIVSNAYGSTQVI